MLLPIRLTESSFIVFPYQRTLTIDKAAMVQSTFLLDSGGEIKKAPMAYVPDFVGNVTQLLDQNER